MAISLTSLRNELLPGLDDIEARIGQPIVAYQAFDRDVLVIRAGENTLEIARSELEDRRHIPRLRKFLETLMCSKSAGTPVSVPPSQASQQFYAALGDAKRLTEAAVRDNMFLSLYNTNVAPLVEPTKPAEPAKPSWPPAPDLILDEPC